MTHNRIKDFIYINQVPHSAALFSLAGATQLWLANGGSMLEKLIIVGNYAMAAGMEIIALGQYRSMIRAEKAIERSGYDRRLIKPFMNTYCGKRIAKRILQNINLAQEYEVIANI